MGKDWLHWVVSDGGGGRGRSSAKKGRRKMEEAAAKATSAGCMSAVFQLFDSHHVQHSSGIDAESSFLQQEDHITFKGVEAPRNGLDLEELPVPPIKVGSLSLAKQEGNLNFPVGINNIKTSHEKISSPRISTKSRKHDISSDCNSPGTKTPTLVARLMGLDLLPEPTSSPAIPSSNSKTQRKDRNTLHTRSNITISDDDISIGARSLPETPRISSSRRSDVEYHRLSLQLNKENILNEELCCKRGSQFKQQQQGYSSQGHFVKQVLKQVRESVNKRAGVRDITNKNYNRKDENLILQKPTKKNPKLLINCENTSLITEPSCSPKLRVLKTNKNKPLSTSSKIKSKRISVKSQEITVPLKEQQKGTKKFRVEKCNSSNLKKLPHQASDHEIRNKKEDPLANKAPRKTPLTSGEIFNISGPTVLLPVKKDPFSHATKLPQKQSNVILSLERSTQLSCNPSHPYKQLQLQTDKNVLPKDNGCATTYHGGAKAEYMNYIQRILRRTGITNKSTSITQVKWHTLSYPLEPSIFHYLELFYSTTTDGGGVDSILSRRCNRKLIFQLVDEILAEILRPHLDFKKWVSKINPNRDFSLVDQLCKRILNFPVMDCQVLEDIDVLIETDLCSSRSNGLLEEEGEGIVCEIEGEIFESLLCDTVAVMAVGGRVTRFLTKPFQQIQLY